MSDTDKPPPILEGAEAAARLPDALIGEMMESFVPAIDDPESAPEKLRERVARAVKELEGARDAGDSFALLEGDELASIAAIVPSRPLRDGRGVYDIGKVMTNPGFTGHGYATQVMRHAVAYAREKYSDAPLIIHTKESRIKSICGGLPGWRELHPRDMWALFDYESLPDEPDDERFAQWQANWDRNGWTVFFFDPQES